MKLLSRIIDAGCRICDVLACVGLFAICAFIFAQVVARMFGGIVPSALELASFSMAAMTFLGLAGTFRAGGHIRVMLAVDCLPPRLRIWAEAFNLALAFVLFCYVCWKTASMVRISYEFGDISMGIVATPLWIPQSSLAIGSGMAAIVLLEELIRLISGGATRFVGEQATGEHHEI